MIVAFDLDGTLANIEHRLHYIQQPKKDWPAFFAACVDDKPIWPLIETCKRFMASAYVEVWSGRSDAVRAETERWIYDHGMGMVRVVRMRKDGDHRPDWQVKQEWLLAMPEQDRPVLAFDDRQQVVDMWRRNGVICCQVAPGDF